MACAITGFGSVGLSLTLACLVLLPRIQALEEESRLRGDVVKIEGGNASVEIHESHSDAVRRLLIDKFQGEEHGVRSAAAGSERRAGGIGGR